MQPVYDWTAQCSVHKHMSYLAVGSLVRKNFRQFRNHERTIPRLFSGNPNWWNRLRVKALAEPYHVPIAAPAGHVHTADERIIRKALRLSALRFPNPFRIDELQVASARG